MTHLDIICKTLSEVSGVSASHFRGNILRGMAASGHDLTGSELLRELTPEEVNKHIEALSTPQSKQGVLRWIVEGTAKAAQATPQQAHKMRTYMRSEQN